MKKVLHHFRISLLLGIMVLCACSYQMSSLFADDSHTHRDLQLLDNTTDAPSKDEGNPDLPKEPSDTFEPTSKLIIKAVNPGYTIDGTQNVGEFIELQKVSDDPNFSLAGYGLRYTNSSGKSTLLLSFSEGSLMTGETLLMRLARSPNSDRADATYMTTLAMTVGQVELVYQDEPIDQVCWGNKTDCSPGFKSSKPTTLVRDLDTGLFDHIIDYEPEFDPSTPSLILPPSPDDSPDNNNPSDSSPEVSARCYDLEFSEILAYYTNDKNEQFIELYNPSDKTITLDQCSIRYKKKIYPLSGEITADGYYAYYPARQRSTFSLTKNPNSSNTIDLIDTNGAVVDTLVYNHGQKKSTSHARFYTNTGDEIWDSTYTPTPGNANNYQEFRNCPADKTINPDTGNCVKITNSGSTTTVCPEGKYLNPLTGRCKKIADDSSSPKPCAAGYERNPETNRCRKIKSDNTGANYALIPNTSSSKSVFIAAGIVGLIVCLGAIYIILQFRREIARTTRKAVQRLNHIRKDLISRRIGFHRNQKP